MRPITVADVFDTQTISDAQVSPDGQWVAFVVADQYKDGKSPTRSQIWIVASAGGEPRPFTNGLGSDRAPRWSPDGEYLAFLSRRGNDQNRDELYLIGRNGGEAWRLFEAKGSVGGDTAGQPYAWSPGGQHIGFIMTDPESDEIKKNKEQRIDPILFERDHRFDRLWIADTFTGEVKCMTPNSKQIWEFDWSPEADALVVITSEEPYEWSWYHAQLAIISLETGTSRTLYDPAPRQITLPIWSPDGSQIAFLQSIWSDRGSVSGELCLIDPVSGTLNRISAQHEISVSRMAWLPNSKSLLALAVRHDGAAMLQWPVDSQPRELWYGDVAIADPFWAKFTGDRSLRTLAFARESLEEPRQIWVAQRDHDSLEWTCLTHFHEQHKGITRPRAKRVAWQSADGWEIDGYLLLPPDAVEGQRYPLYTWVHGGPTSLFMPRFWNSLPMGYYAAKGFAVFLPNPRGSTGRGLKFAEANLGDMGGQDFTDILTGIEYLIEHEPVDADRLAIGGWSYGGFMTAWAVTQTDRFKCAVMGAGIANWLSFHGNSKLCEWDRVHYAADPYELHGKFERFSPLTYIDKVKTPTLLVHGEKDWDVPPSQGYEFFRALKQHGVPTELRVYPREPHGFREKAHQRDWVEYATGWLERWLMG